MKRWIALPLIVLLLGSPFARAQNDVVLDAMKDELARSLGQLRLEGQPAPYYLSYQVRDIRSLEITAASGAITRNSESRYRSLRPDLRVGDYELDNSRSGGWGFPGGGSPYFFHGGPLPLDDDYSVIRRTIWLATDEAYKSALEAFSRKKADLQNAIRTDTLPDFSKGEGFTALKPPLRASFQRAEIESRIEQASKLFLESSRIRDSEIHFKSFLEDCRFVNSEGVVSSEPRVRSILTLDAEAQADDGMPLTDFRAYPFGDSTQAPGPQELAAGIRQVISELSALREAPVAGDYDGPVLFERQAAAEFLAQGFVPHLLAKHASSFSRDENPLLRRLNRRVLAKFLSVRASPGLRNDRGIPLLGAYEVDDEGVRAREVSLVENGILKNVLVSRSPVKGFSRSNGHFRGGGVAPSVIRFVSSQRTSAPELKKILLAKLKEEGLEYGYLVRSVAPASGMFIGGSSREEFRPSKPVLAYRVYPDGREELVRGAELGNLNVRAFRDIVAAGDDELVYNYPLPSPGLFATILAPAFILPDVEIKKSSGNYRQPPIVSYPSK